MSSELELAVVDTPALRVLTETYDRLRAYQRETPVADVERGEALSDAIDTVFDAIVDELRANTP